MAIDFRQAKEYLSKLLRGSDSAALTQRLRPKSKQEITDSKARMPRNYHITDDAVAQRWEAMNLPEAVQNELLDEHTKQKMSVFERNIENFIGTVKLPIGIAGPLRVNGLHAQGEYYIPLATTEAALVASYNRGALLMSMAGGCTSMVLSHGVTRAPGFAFSNLMEVGQFMAWVVNQFDEFKRVAQTTTNHGVLNDIRLSVEGNHVYLIFEYSTGDASGQNMVTIATDAVVTHLLETTPIKPQYHFLEANMSGDKKASAQSFLTVRGKKVSTEVLIPGKLVQKVLHTSAERMVDYWRMSAIGGVLSGTIGVQGHYANGLAALYIACGQDAACVSESSVGVTRFELTDNGDLYASVSLPNLIVGTVGGGTGLPSQNASLQLMGLAGAGNAMAFAEVCAAICLAGELSIIGALCAGHFSRAHKQLARG